MEIKINEWVRTIQGDIYQNTPALNYICETDLKYNQITNHSFEELELIEEGDYVNGKEVITIVPADICGDETSKYPRFYTECGEVPYEQLETLVTKEKFNEQKILIKRGG